VARKPEAVVVLPVAALVALVVAPLMTLLVVLLVALLLEGQKELPGTLQSSPH